MIKPFIIKSFTLTFLLVFVFTQSFVLRAQDEIPDQTHKSVFLELFGQGFTVSGNYDFRFQKGQSHGLGMRMGLGYINWDLGPLLSKGSMFSIPVEVNYLTKGKMAFEAGAGLSLVSFKFSELWWFLEGKGTTFMSYLPVGLRWNPPVNGLMLKANVGPMIWWEGLSEKGSLQLYGGFAIGYSFY